MELKNKKLTDDEFFKERADVLTHWETGKGVDFQEAVDYQKSIAPEKRFAYKLQKAVENGDTLIQPRAGVALYEEHIKLLRFLEDEGEADLLPSTVDSYTRLNRYKECEVGIQKASKPTAQC